MVSLPTFTRMEIVSGGSPLTGHLFFWDIWAAMAWRCHPGQGFVAQALVYLCKNRNSFSWLGYHWNSLALGCACLPTPGDIYLWEGFWNSFLLDQTCEAPATARGNHFRPFVCLDNLHVFICCTGTCLFVQEQKRVETVLADLRITEIHWHWVAPAYPPWKYLSLGRFLEWFPAGPNVWGPASARGNLFRPFVCLDSLDSLDMLICCTGIGLLVEEQKMAETVLADLIITEIHWHWVVPAYLPLEIFIFGKGSEMVSCLNKRVKYQLLQGEPILDHLYA